MISKLHFGVNKGDGVLLRKGTGVNCINGVIFTSRERHGLIMGHVLVVVLGVGGDLLLKLYCIVKNSGGFLKEN